MSLKWSLKWLKLEVLRLQKVDLFFLRRYNLISLKKSNKF